MSTQGGLSKSPKPHSNRRGLRTALQRYVSGGAFLGVYLLCAVYYLDGSEAPGQDDNIIIVTLGAAIFTALGAWAGPYMPLLLTGAGSKANQRLSRSRNRHSNK